MELKRSATQRAVASVQEASRSPDARRLVARGETFVRQVAGTDSALGEVERSLRGLAERAGELASRLSGLEGERESLLNSIWRAHATAYSPDTMHVARAELDRLNGELRSVERRIEGLRHDWVQACETSASAVRVGEQTLASAHRGIASRELGRRAFASTRAGLSVYGGTAASLQLGRTTVRGYRTLESRSHLRRLEGGLTTAADYYDERRLPRRTRRQMARQHNRPILNQLPDARRTHHRELSGLNKNRPLTQAGRALQESAKYTRFVKGVGVAGVFFSAQSAYSAWQAGDAERVATSALTAAGSAMMIFPATAPAGAVLVAGAMIYENREAIVKGAKKAKDWVGDKVSNGLKKLNPFSR